MDNKTNNKTNKKPTIKSMRRSMVGKRVSAKWDDGISDCCLVMAILDDGPIKSGTNMRIFEEYDNKTYNTSIIDAKQIVGIHGPVFSEFI